MFVFRTSRLTQLAMRESSVEAACSFTGVPDIGTYTRPLFAVGSCSPIRQRPRLFARESSWQGLPSFSASPPSAPIVTGRGAERPYGRKSSAGDSKRRRLPTPNAADAAECFVIHLRPEVPDAGFVGLGLL